MAMGFMYSNMNIMDAFLANLTTIDE